MIIKIDTRENELHIQCVQKACSFESIKVESVTLHIGDVIICDDQGIELLIIERKTLNDLASSIKDGRYGEQGFRLDGCSLPNHNIFYLVEGNLATYDPYKSRLERRSLISSFVTLTYIKGFSLHRTENINESVEWIISYADKLHRTNSKSYYDTTKENNITNYTNVVARVKKENITKENIDILMLSQIPNVSVAVSTSIVKEHGNISQLITKLAENSKLLDNVCIITKNGKERKIPKNAINNIYDYLQINF
jgi:ERCC4-type nuclease